MALYEVWALVYAWSLIFMLVIFELERREEPCVHGWRYVAWIWTLRVLLAVSLLVVLWAAPHVVRLQSLVGEIPFDLGVVYGAQLGIDAVGALIFHWKGRHDFECLFSVNFPFLIPYTILPLKALYNELIERRGFGIPGYDRPSRPRIRQRSAFSISGSHVDSRAEDVEQLSGQSASFGVACSAAGGEGLGGVDEGCRPTVCVHPSRGFDGSDSEELALSKRMVQEILLRMRP